MPFCLPLSFNNILKGYPPYIYYYTRCKTIVQYLKVITKILKSHNLLQ
nr:MAG TPA: hypothetical protein [Caudoviricetes sp.]